MKWDDREKAKKLARELDRLAAIRSGNSMGNKGAEEQQAAAYIRELLEALDDLESDIEGHCGASYWKGYRDGQASERKANVGTHKTHVGTHEK
jgi:hypothetical protein